MLKQAGGREVNFSVTLRSDKETTPRGSRSQLGHTVKKSSRGGSECPYRKPTQVGGERILRCAGKPSLRNSAKCIRNFGKRIAPACELRTEGAGGGGRREAQATVYHKHRCLRKRNLKYKC